ncbi:hypothetical protein PFAG_02925 [Plasmodium falciparum Santa Lucia]|uniref:ATP synthase-associated protein, putative n=15 Tax=Plasmodium falciparum TaxID=5833 RepID=Q8IJG2_PLAF7|nr:ATP synthase-associated protein, putative [Plasmodium falciparum 3D7]ETW18043.1 hypothetical protein PFFVO_02936 [Plasmodium falciparum Vietnam Oak-Knoll (FVO)]ETW28577.1 hypothetical protein PFFCH_03948 [Plasmodium falciparum FCH/4]ETW36302.1 hypothetical protein PFTANZ_03006 [Plasmodium falciparum Tanzania (2000708)]ETW42426.1 hypothetical protein PFNF135_03088 [Plasmodium falciparum NF135/5.C10]ETW48973.1 hypothetical protein PFMALIP_02930 [Plasmodium falciparum MaliPS096_E11]ETW56669.1|eukprot:XP_001347520.1 conserved Plasmodium protein, unknown function [Plasmodium falciparum 3D7]
MFDNNNNMSKELKQLEKEKKNVEGNNLNLLLGDLKMMTAYEMSSEWKDTNMMNECFNNFSWFDSRILRNMQNYLNADDVEKSKIDYAYNTLFPKPIDIKDTKLNMMALWIKSRIHYNNTFFPLQLSPYDV